jgi:hypothetical protein
MKRGGVYRDRLDFLSWRASLDFRLHLIPVPIQNNTPSVYFLSVAVSVMTVFEVLVGVKLEVNDASNLLAYNSIYFVLSLPLVMILTPYTKIANIRLNQTNRAP